MSFHLVTVFHVQSPSSAESLQAVAIQQFRCTGVEEYSLSEPEVDALLGERSYSGGDLPLEVLGEVDQTMAQARGHLKFYFAGDDLDQARGFEQLVRAHFLCEVQLETLADQDWNAEWKKHYGPIAVSSKMVVLPEWVDPTSYPDSVVIRIHPGMGFGTGSHETTFLCLKSLAALDLPDTGTGLDYGSGSGILGIAALLARPKWEMLFVDIDPEAHRNCQQNLELNRLAASRSKMRMVEERPTAQRFPLVFANILQGILHQECAYLVATTAIGGHLILSGLLRHQVPETRDLYLATQRLELVSEELKNDWGCLTFRCRS